MTGEASKRARYYAVRYKSHPLHIRIEKAATPLRAAELCFGGPILKISLPRMEYKDLGTTKAIVQSDKKRIEALNDPNNWVTLSEAK